MRVRYCDYDKFGNGPHINCECDLTPRKARNLFNKLKENYLCIWAELVIEDEEEGGEYLEIIDSFDNELAETNSKLRKIQLDLFDRRK